jgi:hypothetical protein
MRGKSVSHVAERVSAMPPNVSTSLENALNPTLTVGIDGI